nr:putative concanavalin A-like lectin/glucanase domain-containing protein [Oceanusvirus sp.]
MPSVVDVTLNVAAAVMVAILLVTSVREDLVRFFAIGYAIFFVVAMLVPDGGQVNVSVALGLLAHALLTWMSEDTDTPDSIIKQRETVRIFEGVMTAKANVARSYNTYDPTSTTYKRLPRSINRMGGAQMSYSMWIAFDRGMSDEDVAGKTLFMRGDDKHYSPMTSNSDEKDVPQDAYFPGSGSDYTIACPRVSFLKANQLAIDVNTDRELRHRFVVGSSDPSVEMRKNALSLIPGHFTLFTIVLEDNVGIDSFERGIRCKFYINDQLYHTGTAPGALRQNDGPLHLFLDPTPDTKTGLDGCMMADMTYYNYGLEDKDVAALYARGFVNTAFKDRNSMFDKDVRLVMSPYNKLDIGANYDDRLHSYDLAA